RPRPNPNMSRILAAHFDDLTSLDRLSGAIRAWEPRFDLVAARDNPMIYEPDGLLYAAAVPPASTLVARHKVRAFRPGDLAIVPRAGATDAEGEGASYVAIRYDGEPPQHFRERFLQTWGYEHRSPEGRDGDPARDVTGVDDPRFRVPFRRVAIGPATP